MKHFLILLTNLLFLLTACQEQKNAEIDKSIFGDLKGIVTDSLTKKPIANAEIYVVYQLPTSKTGEEKRITTKTDIDGKFSIKDLAGEVLIRAKKSRFSTTFLSYQITPTQKDKLLKISLNGMPAIYNQFVNDLELDYEVNDSSVVVLEIKDLYNEQKDGKANAFIHFYDLATNMSMGALELETSFKTATFTTLRGIVSANMFPKPEPGIVSQIGYYYEIIDPDKTKVEYGLEEEDTLKAIRIF